MIWQTICFLREKEGKICTLIRQMLKEKVAKLITFAPKQDQWGL